MNNHKIRLKGKRSGKRGLLFVLIKPKLVGEIVVFVYKFGQWRNFFGFCSTSIMSGNTNE